MANVGYSLNDTTELLLITSTDTCNKEQKISDELCACGNKLNDSLLDFFLFLKNDYMSSSVHSYLIM